MWHSKWHLVRVAGTIGLALAAPVITFWLPGAADWVAALAALAFFDNPLLDLKALGPSEASQVHHFARSHSELNRLRY